MKPGTKVVMQIYTGQKAYRNVDSFTINDTGLLNVPQIAAGLINALVMTHCAVHNLDIIEARQVLSDVKAGIETMHLEPTGR